MRPIILACALLAAISAPAARADNDDGSLRALFDAFVAAQNAHDTDALAALLLPTPEFLWITPAGPAFGHRLFLDWQERQYRGIWRLAPDAAGVRIVAVAPGVAQVQARVAITSGRDRDNTDIAPMAMTLVAARAAAGWKIVGLWWQPADSTVEHGIVVAPRPPLQVPAGE